MVGRHPGNAARRCCRRLTHGKESVGLLNARRIPSDAPAHDNVRPARAARAERRELNDAPPVELQKWAYGGRPGLLGLVSSKGTASPSKAPAIWRLLQRSLQNPDVIAVST